MISHDARSIDRSIGWVAWLRWPSLALPLLLWACGDVAGPEVGVPEDPELQLRAAVVSDAVITEMEGDGTLGDGEPTGNGGIRLQEFVFQATADLSGFVDLVDHSVIRADGSSAELHAGPTVPGTAITSFLQTSSTCVTFTGIGQLDTGETKEFEIEVCDNGTPGTGLDVFGIAIPSRPYYRGPDMLSDGEIVRSTAAL